MTQVSPDKQPVLYIDGSLSAPESVKRTSAADENYPDSVLRTANMLLLGELTTRVALGTLPAPAVDLTGQILVLSSTGEQTAQPADTLDLGPLSYNFNPLIRTPKHISAHPSGKQIQLVLPFASDTQQHFEIGNDFDYLLHDATCELRPFRLRQFSEKYNLRGQTMMLVELALATVIDTTGDYEKSKINGQFYPIHTEDFTTLDHKIDKPARYVNRLLKLLIGK